MYYLVFPDGSKLFQTPYPEDFVYHCLLLAIDKGLGLIPVKVLDYRGLFLLLVIELFYFLCTCLCFAFFYLLRSSVFSAFLVFFTLWLYFFRFLSFCSKLPPLPCLPFNLSA